LRTNLKRPVKVNRLTRMFVPNPKYAFQSPGVQSGGGLAVVAGAPAVIVAVVMLASP
jgi:hypothetical protein